MFGGYGTTIVRDLETAIQLCPQQYIVYIKSINRVRGVKRKYIRSAFRV